MSRKVLLISLLVVLVATLVVASADAQGPISTLPKAPTTNVGTAFTYQGQLKKNGVPVSSSCNVSFKLYSDAGGANLVAGPVNGSPNPVTVANGMFTVQVDFGVNAFTGGARWLATAVQCTGDGGYNALSPLQPLTAVPYALGLAPGAVISGTLQNELTAFANTSVIGNPIALHGIAGQAANLFPIVPIAVWGESHAGNGVLASSDTGYGITAYSHSNSSNAVYANNDSGGDAIQGVATTGNGVYGITNNGSTKAAIYGENTGGGYGVIGLSSNIPIYAHNTGIGGSTAYLASPCCAADLYGDVNVNGNLTVSGSKSGFVVDFAKNADSRSLSAGDVVALIGSTSPLVGNIPVALVVKADSAYQTGVVGVVNEHITPGDHLGYDSQPIESGEYLSVVTLGMFRAIQVDASFGKIHAGDLLVASPHAGYAMKATDRVQAIGAIIGKAMGDLDSGVGTLPVLVTLQ